MGLSKTVSGLIVIGVLFFAIILSASIMGVFKGNEPYQQLIAAMLSVAATGVITALLLIFQRKQQEELTSKQQVFEKERLQETKVFEERLRIYKEFLGKLCNVVKDQKITPEEEIELQFQVSYIAMHTSSESINNISKQISEIVVNLKQDNPDANNMLMQLFSIADCFYDELYKEKYKFDPEDREETINYFRAILVPTNKINEYEESLELRERTRRLKRLINNNGAIQRIYNGTVLFHEYFTSRENRHYVDSNEKIVIDLMPEEDNNRYAVLLSTRQKDIDKTKELVKGIWPNEEYHPWSAKDSHAHVHETISFNESDEVIKDKIEKVLQEAKAYRNKEYPLK